MTTLDELKRSDQVTTDVPTAGEVIGIGRGLAYELARRGELPGAIRLGHRWRVSIPQLVRAIEGDETNRFGESPDLSGPP